MQGIIRVVQYFKNRGHEEIVCFLPQRYRHKVRSPSEERTVTLFEKDNIFSFTPSRNLDNGKRITPYDDRYIYKFIFNILSKTCIFCVFYIKKTNLLIIFMNIF